MTYSHTAHNRGSSLHVWMVSLDAEACQWSSLQFFVYSCIFCLFYLSL